VYESKVDLDSAAQAARSQCLMGTTMCLCGFAGVLVGAPTASPGLKGMVVFGAAASTYKHAVLAKKEFGNVAMRHVEQVVLKPSKAPTSGSATDSQDIAHGTAEERLAATRELELLVRTPNLDMRFVLGEPAAAWEGAKYSGLVADERPKFSEVCKAMLHFDEASDKPDSPVIPDVELLAALRDCDKVVVDREVTVRSHLEADGLLTAPPETPHRIEGMVDDVGKSAAGSGSNSQRAAGHRKPPAMEIKMIGRSSVVSGFVFQIAGLIFLSRLISGGEDPTLGELYMKFKYGSAAPPKQ